MAEAAREAKYRELRAAVDAVPAIDAHAHNLVALDSSFPFLRCFSEAEGDALLLAPQTLSFKRSLREIAGLYGCEASLDGVENYRRSSGLHSIASKCFQAANIAALLIDDGIPFDKMHDLASHESFAPTVRRILRIEYLAETILNDVALGASKWTLDSFMEKFVTRMKSVANEIVAMKSIAAYRSGLDIDPDVTKIAAEEGLLEDMNVGRPVRIKNKSFIDYLFACSLEVAVSFNLPMQIHTGFGDKDLDLRQSNPLHLRKVLEDKRFSHSRIVLLHASYPFSKEASYLASVYSQVYLDFGLAVPKLSVQGMVASLKELLHLAPLKKVMFSSDGYAFPETFFLGAKRAREVVFHVLSNACDDGDLTIPEAFEAVEDIFRRNSLQLYKLNGITSSIDNQIKISAGNPSKSSTSPDGIVFVRVIWVDNSGKHRCRVIPKQRFYEYVKNTGIGLPVCSMAMTSFSDGPAMGTNLTAVGEIRLIPDLSTKYCIPWSRHEEMVLADMHIAPGVSWEYCPRNALRRAVKVLKDEFNLVMNAGFENEFFLLKNIISEGKEQWVPFDTSRYCATSAFDYASSLLQEVNVMLQSLDISVEQLHAEAGNGQFEIVLGHKECTLAADNLIYAREVIRAVARKHGYLATFIPKYRLDDIGSGSHVHLSLWENGTNVYMGSETSKHRYGMSQVGEKFMAGVFHHLPSILAITAPLPNSYDRLQPNTWSGAYHCWGRENKEAPLRAASPPGVSNEVVSNFELKTFDGCANPYVGLAAIAASGIDGLRRGLCLPEPVETNPCDLDSELKRLPKELQESIEALSADKFLIDFIGEKLITAVLGVRKAEVDYYSKNKDGCKELIYLY